MSTVVGRAGIAAIHGELRGRILAGQLGPGQVLSQVGLAEELGISRTPLREALRMLQEEGLVVAEHNRRMRVAGFDADELEAVYASRILLESLGVSVSAPRFTAEDLAGMTSLLADMRGALEAGDLWAWEARHQRFHRLLFSRVPRQLAAGIQRSFERGERYRVIYYRVRGGSPRTASLADAEHEAIRLACARADGELAARGLARHLARTALSLIAELAPEHDPVAIRTALRFVVGDQGVTEHAIEELRG